MLNIFLITFIAGVLAGYIWNLMRDSFKKQQIDIENRIKMYKTVRKRISSKGFKNYLLNILLFLILFGMGLKLGAGTLYQQYAEIAFQSVIIALATAGGSVILVFAGRRFFMRRGEEIK